MQHMRQSNSTSYCMAEYYPGGMATISTNRDAQQHIHWQPDDRKTFLAATFNYFVILSQQPRLAQIYGMRRTAYVTMFVNASSEDQK